MKNNFLEALRKSGVNVISNSEPKERVVKFQGLAQAPRIGFVAAANNQAKYKRLLAWNNLQPLLEKFEGKKNMSDREIAQTILLGFICDLKTSDAEVMEYASVKLTDALVRDIVNLKKSRARLGPM